VSDEDAVSAIIEQLENLLDATRDTADEVTSPRVAMLLRTLAADLDRTAGELDAGMCTLSHEWRDGRDFEQLYPDLFRSHSNTPDSEPDAHP
jgi:hypothetical protein